MKQDKVVKAAAVALLAVTLASQTVAATGGQVQAEETRFSKEVSVSQTVVADEFTQDEYTQAQVEFLIYQIVADEIAAEENAKLSYAYADLYYDPDNKAGYVIDFKYNDSCGYIIMLVDDDKSTPTEIALDRKSPYYGKSGTYLYPAQGNHYIMADNGEIVDALQYTAVSDKPQNVVMMNSDKGSKTPYRDTYECTNVESPNKHTIPYVFCGYNTGYYGNIWDKPLEVPPPNNCANIAGVIALNYWNVYFNYDLLKLKDNQFMSDTDPNMSYVTAYNYAELFYKYMETNNWFGNEYPMIGEIVDWYSDGRYGGTYPKYGYRGFERLIKEKGYEAERIYTPKYEDIKRCIDRNIPVFVTAEDYYFGNVYDERDHQNNKWTFVDDGNYYTGIKNRHTFVAYGYQEYTLTLLNGNSITFNYLQVANGWGGTSYYNMDKSHVMSAAAIKVSKKTLPRC